ncbi:hypothetical protein HOP40_06565 [Pseudonocardia broussonetiae]|uniref:DUF1622 domain-containing protein n=1 Tax=Pseudonocardia broussonetiae TaxID=2736640 RepID=A0A6M6JSR8_9PSEU|nr:hypothetical protein HOP40_06565 [Pseudonocardia broussonetiae]
MVDAAAFLVVAAALVSAAVVLIRTRDGRRALPVLLDLLTAAGLIRLAGPPSWPVLATTAIVIVLRRLLTAGLRSASASAVRPPS